MSKYLFVQIKGQNPHHELVDYTNLDDIRKEDGNVKYEIDLTEILKEGPLDFKLKSLHIEIKEINE